MAGKTTGAVTTVDAQVEACGHGELVLMAGVVVHYVLGADGPGSRQRGEVRPAVVVRIWGEVGAAAVPAADREERPLVQLQVFLDGTNDDPIDGAGLTWRSSVRYSAERDELGGWEPGTWHWPHEEWQPAAGS